MKRVRARALATAVGVALLAGACGSSSSGSARPGAATTPRPPAQQLFVVLGDQASAPIGEAISVGDSWPQWFFRTALSRDTVFVNLAEQVASARFALRVELPLARELHPSIAGVLVGFADAAGSGPVDRFSEALDGIITGLRAAGARTILVATLPDEMRGVKSYNKAIVDIASNDGAVLVDLTPLTVTFLKNTADITPVPDRASQRAIGSAFAAAYRAAASSATNTARP